MAAAKLVKSSQDFVFGVWHITSEQSHILPSQCTNGTNILCADLKGENKRRCNFCQYETQLALPKLPDMTFADNYLKVQHSNGFGLLFNCFDALGDVQNPRNPMKVAVAEAWSEARFASEADGIEHAKEVIKPFDWTFYTTYKGTLIGDKKIQVIPTTDRIDLEKLKVKEEIKFYEDICLFEDELADNGIAQLSAKMRVMESGFFILLRYFLRVDGVVAKFHDTRIYHETGKDYMLRECCTREDKLTDVNIPTSILINPPQLAEKLTIKEIQTDILKFTDT